MLPFYIRFDEQYGRNTQLAFSRKQPHQAGDFRFGFSLPEVLITIVLMSILFSLGVIFISSMGTTKKMRSFETAVALAQQAIELMRASPYDQLDDADAKDNSVEYDLNNSNNGIDLMEPTFNAGSIKYTRKVEVTNVPGANSDGTPIKLKLVKVSVKWVTPDGDHVPYEITTTISDLN